MTVYRKIALIMLAVFVGIYLLGATIYVQQARHDVQREMSGVAELASYLSHPQKLPAAAVASVRHLQPADELSADSGRKFPLWFFNAINADTPAIQVNGWVLDPADEVEEVWEGFVLVSLAYGIGMLLCFLALFLTVRQSLRPLVGLSRAMNAVADGCMKTRLPRQSVQELDTLAQRFNEMAEALETEQKTVSRLLNELLELQDREREHIARVLHDDLGQYLTGIRAQARSLLYDPDLSERQKRQACELAEHCETVQKHFRLLLQDLHPLAMEQLGLSSAIRYLADQWQQLSGLDCRLAVDDGLPEFTGEQQTHLYRFLQEALNNVSRHANASCATLVFVRNGGELNIEVRDDGVGQDAFRENVGLGVRSMRERARCLGGDVEFLSRVGDGTLVRLAIPLTNLLS
ncbi:HAMP domain-containing sensor histidine kinase [Marinobacter shengliensis]|uniref:histidine kinase n=1 Tax=Marinobacter shengliensis TaxID=1389223 RepID=A0ABV4W6H3_9GAMM